MIARRPSGTENKLFMLRAIERLGAVTAEQLLVFMVENEYMDYISMQLGLAELVEAGLLKREKHQLGALYALTGKGRDALSMFGEKVPHSRRAAIDEVADRWRLRFRREKQMLSDIQRGENGEYVVRLRLLEKGYDLLDLRVSVPTNAQAQRFARAWIEKATGIYAHVVHSLGEEQRRPEDP